MLLLCLFITLLIFSSHYVLLAPVVRGSILSRTLAAALLTCAQIILSELFLGLFGLLYLSVVVLVNLLLVILVLLLLSRRAGGASWSLQNDTLQVKEGLRSALNGPALLLGTLAILTYGWILAAAYYLPPRGIDDLCYHLPAVFEYYRSHEIRLLPLFTPQFAFPENAELLFLWPVLFTHDQGMVDAANVPFVLLSVLTLYALARHFSLPKRDALFAALLYAFCPVVLMQAGVNYVDIIVSAFLLLSIYFTLRYSEDQHWLDATLAGLSIGLLCGMKYTAPFLVLPLQFLMVPALRKGRWRHAAAYLSIMLLAGGWWYLRNAVVLGEPMFPVHVHARVPEGLVNLRGGTIFQNIHYNLPYWIARYLLQDARVGTYDGGFGLVFWGMGLSSWLYVTFHSMFIRRTSGIPRLIVLSYVPIGFILLLSMPPRFIEYNGRLAMFVVAVGLFAFTEVLAAIHERVYKGIIKGISLVLSVASVSLLVVSLQPLYRFSEAFADARNGVKSSEFKYLAASYDPHVALRPAWELLDLLTRDNRSGLNCFIASDPEIYWSAPVYGSRLQNRVINMAREEAVPVDAYVCTFSDKKRLTSPFLAAPGPGGTTTIRDVLAKSDYVSVVHSENCCLLLRRDIFVRPEKQRILLEYYRKAWPDAVDLANRLQAQLDPVIPFIASNEIGYALRSVDMMNHRPDRVLVAVDGREEVVAVEKKLRQCYTVDRPLSGYQWRKVAQSAYRGKELDVFLNRRTWE